MEIKDLAEKARSSFASLKSAKSAIDSGNSKGWGKIINIPKKKDNFALGYVLHARR